MTVRRRRYSPAEAVAARLRERILSGAVADGELLPKIDDLAGEFGVSRAAIREASLILESEGLLSVRRGNVGGSVVHLPRAGHVAYALGLVLETAKVALDDVRAAIERFEPVCVELCAERPDRATTVLPALDAAQHDYREALAHGDGAAAVAAARAWHEAIVAQCGSPTAAVTVGTLETLWSSHLRARASASAGRGEPIAQHDAARVGDEHDHIRALIAAGDGPGAAAAARAHVREARVHAASDDDLGPVCAARLRDDAPR